MAGSKNYNIYVHYLNYGAMASNSATQPVNQIVNKITEIKSTRSYSISSISPRNMLFGMKNMGGVGGTIGMAKRLNPYLMIAKAAVDMANFAVNTSIDFYTGYSGNYTVSRDFNNFKTSIEGILNPISTALNYEKRRMEVYNKNQTKIENMSLLGDVYKGV